MNRPLLWALAGTLLSVGCSRGPGHYVEAGNRYASQGKIDEAALQYQKAAQKDTSFGEAYYRLGLLELKRNRSQDAFRQLSQAVHLMPDNMDARVKLAELCLNRYVSDPRKPKAFYEKLSEMTDQLLAKDPNSFDGLRLKGSQAMLDRRPKDAVELFGKADRVKPSDPGLTLELAQALFQENRASEGEKLLLALIDRQKDNLSVYDTLHRHFRLNNRPAEAGKVLELKVRNNPKDPSSVLQLAAYYHAAKRPSDVTPLLRRMLDHPEDFPQAHLEVGDFYAKTGRPEPALHEFEEGGRARPQDKILYLKAAANLLMSLGRRQEAAKAVDEILAAAPRDAEARTIRATLRLDSGQPDTLDQTIKDLRVLTAERPRSEELRYLLGRAYLAKGDFQHAREQLREAETLQRNFVAPRIALAELSLRESDFPLAIRHAESALRIQPGNLNAHMLRGAALLGSGKTKEARAELALVLSASPKHREARLNLGLAAVVDRNFKEAEKIFQALQKEDQNDPRAAVALARAYSAQSQYQKAVEVLDAELRRTPDSRPISLLLAAVNTQSGRYDSAIEQYHQLLQKNPDDSRLLTNLAHLYRRKGDLSSAIAALEKATKANPKDVVAIALLADSLQTAGRLPEAATHYRSALALRSDDPVFLNNLAYLVAESGGNLEEALTLAQKAMQKAPTEAPLSDTLGLVYLKKNMPDSALQIFARLVKQHPDHPGYRLHLGMTLLTKGDKAGARRELEAALKKQPGTVDQAKIKELLASMG